MLEGMTTRSSAPTCRTGGQVETGDPMPEDYRKALIKFIEMHGNSELMGVLPEREWILRAPTLQRKLALTAKVQDEVGHGQLIYRVVEDLGKPRDACFDDLIAGKTKFHNVFHYPTKTWGDVGVIAWLVDAAAIISQKALLKCSYAPYARIMKKICWEESFHILHGRDVVPAMMTGTDEQRELVQEALDRWWGPLMQFHGIRSRPRRTPCSSGGSRARPTRRPASGSSTATCPDLGARPHRAGHGAAKDDETGVWHYHGAGLGRAQVGRHRPRPRDGAATRRAPRARRRPGCAGRSSPTRRDLGGLPPGAARASRSSTAARSRRPNREFAEAYAVEFYGRPRESVALWVVPREAIVEIDRPYIADVFDRDYRRVDGYSLKVKLKEARERAGTA